MLGVSRFGDFARREKNKNKSADWENDQSLEIPIHSTLILKRAITGRIKAQ